MSQRSLDLGVNIESIQQGARRYHIAHCPHGPSPEIPSADDIPDELAAEIQAWLDDGAVVNTATAANPAASLASKFETAPPAVRLARWGVSSERAPIGAGEASPDATFRRASAELPAAPVPEHTVSVAKRGKPGAPRSAPAKKRKGRR
jgi:hypothetical protein